MHACILTKKGEEQGGGGAEIYIDVYMTEIAEEVLVLMIIILTLTFFFEFLDFGLGADGWG